MKRGKITVTFTFDYNPMDFPAAQYPERAWGSVEERVKYDAERMLHDVNQIEWGDTHSFFDLPHEIDVHSEITITDDEEN